MKNLVRISPKLLTFIITVLSSVEIDDSQTAGYPDWRFKELHARIVY
jgi:hypothetical protein